MVILVIEIKTPEYEIRKIINRFKVSFDLSFGLH